MVKKTSPKTPNVKLWIAIITLLLLQVATISYLVKSYTDQKAASTAQLSQTINELELRRYMTPVIDVNKSRVYIPENRIFLPLTDTSRKLQYYASTRFKAKDLYLSLFGVIGRQSTTDSPSCDRMIRISTSKAVISNEELVGEIAPTKDGLRYIFQNKSHCDVYPDGANTSLAEATKLIQQY